ncbi:hypothetical protein [Anabaena azotica]|uniref:hypothetical protein n=1 Tax=Anabaena azotica TaxID=197653 RepID=UPI0039A6EA3C
MAIGYGLRHAITIAIGDRTFITLSLLIINIITVLNLRVIIWKFTFMRLWGINLKRERSPMAVSNYIIYVYTQAIEFSQALTEPSFCKASGVSQKKIS